jgi:hypothetical protein
MTIQPMSLKRFLIARQHRPILDQLPAGWGLRQGQVLIPDRARVFIVEHIVPGPETAHHSKLFDIHMRTVQN